MEVMEAFFIRASSVITQIQYYSVAFSNAMDATFFLELRDVLCII